MNRYLRRIALALLLIIGLYAVTVLKQNSALDDLSVDNVKADVYRRDDVTNETAEAEVMMEDIQKRMEKVEKGMAEVRSGVTEVRKEVEELDRNVTTGRAGTTNVVNSAKSDFSIERTNSRAFGRTEPGSSRSKPGIASSQLLSGQVTMSEGATSAQMHRSSTEMEIQPLTYRIPVKVTSVNCAAILAGDMMESSRAEYYMRLQPQTDDADANIAQLALNCSNFKRQRAYVLHPMTSEEASFPVAFSLLVFTNVAQVERLLRAIYRPQNVYCLHYDAYSMTAFKQALQNIASCFPNVFIIPESRVVWGWFSVLEPEIRCMRALWESKVKWRYFINLTGQEFPLKTNWQLVRILKAFNGANDIAGKPGPAADQRVRFVHKGIEPTRQRKPPFPVQLNFTKGPVHMAASRAFVDYVLHNETAIRLLDWIRDSGVPDETYFGTLNNNPQLGIPGAYTGNQRHKRQYVTRHKVWRGDAPCRGKWVRAICVFGLGDLPSLASSAHLFANKFHLNFQPLAFDCMEEWHHIRTQEEYRSGRPNVNETYYANLAFVRNRLWP